MGCLTTGKPLEMFQEYKNPLMWHSGPNSPPLLRLRHLGHHGSSNKTEKCGFLFTFKGEKWPQNSIITDRCFFLPNSHGEKNYLRRVGRKKWNKDTELRSWCCFCSWVYFPYPKTRNWQILNHELWVEKKKFKWGMTQVRYVDQLDLANFCLQSLLPLCSAPNRLLLSITKAELSSLTLALSSESV